MRLTTSQNALNFGMKCSKLCRFLGLRPRPRWEAYGAPPDPLVGRGFLPSAIAASRLRACNFRGSHVYTRKNLKFPPAQSPSPWRLQHLNFFTFKMSHYLKSLKICPATNAYSPLRKKDYIKPIETWK